MSKQWKRNLKDVKRMAENVEDFSFSKNSNFIVNEDNDQEEEKREKRNFKEDRRVANGFFSLDDGSGRTDLRSAFNNSSFNPNRKRNNDKRDNSHNDRRDNKHDRDNNYKNDRNKNNERDNQDNRIHPDKIDLAIQLKQLEVKFAVSQYSHIVSRILDAVDDENDLYDVNKFKINAQMLITEFQSNEYRIFNQLGRLEEAIKSSNNKFKSYNKKEVEVEVSDVNYVEVTMKESIDNTVDNALAVTLQNLAISGVTHIKSFYKDSEDLINNVVGLLPKHITDQFSVARWIAILKILKSIFANAKDKFGVDFFLLLCGILSQDNIKIMEGGFNRFYNKFKECGLKPIEFAKKYIGYILAGRSITGDKNMISVNRESIIDNMSLTRTLIRDFEYNVNYLA